MLTTTEKEIDFKPASRFSELIGVFLIIAAVAVYVLFTRTVQADMAVLGADFDTAQLQLTEMKTEIENVGKAQNEYKLTNEVDRSQSIKQVPSEMEQDEVIRRIIEISEKNDIKLSSIGFSKGSAGVADVGTLGVTASFEGNYLTLDSFLKDLETSPRLFKVNSISAQISKLELSDVERVFFTLNIEAFFQK